MKRPFSRACPRTCSCSRSPQTAGFHGPLARPFSSARAPQSEIRGCPAPLRTTNPWGLSLQRGLKRTTGEQSSRPIQAVLARIESTLSTIRMTIAFKTAFKLVPLPNLVCIPHAIFNLVITISWFTTMPQTSDSCLESSRERWVTPIVQLDGKIIAIHTRHYSQMYTG